MILAAGLGTRLRPLTNDRPTALVEVSGQTLLEINLQRLASFGIRDIIVNVHHFADMVTEYLKQHDNFGLRIEISREDLLLDTGGGLKKASWFFLAADSEEPFVLHNVDVLSMIDLERMLRSHKESGALATLAIQSRNTSRYLLFDECNELCGRKMGREGSPEMVRLARKVEESAFSGIHVISPRLLRMISEDGVFSIITTYLRLAGSGQRITGFHADEYYWRDLGTAENVKQAASDIQEQVLRV
jgi:NDP-sugar pyrophosphorylase family protein